MRECKDRHFLSSAGKLHPQLLRGGRGLWARRPKENVIACSGAEALPRPSEGHRGLRGGGGSCPGAPRRERAGSAPRVGTPTSCYLLCVGSGLESSSSWEGGLLVNI